MSMLDMFKIFIRGVLVILTHLQAIETHLEMYNASNTMREEINLFTSYLQD